MMRHEIRLSTIEGTSYISGVPMNVMMQKTVINSLTCVKVKKYIQTPMRLGCMS